MHSQRIDAFKVNGRTTVRSGDGVFLRVPASSPTVEAYLSDELAERVRAELAERRESRIRSLPGRQRIAILAPKSWRQELESVFSDLATTWLEDADNIPASAKLVLHVAGAPSERVALDYLPASGIAVLRCYREGELFFVDPLAAEPQDPSGSQVLRRRLAASPAATELNAWLDASPAPDASSENIPATARAIMLARIRTVIAAWQQDVPSLSTLRRNLWRFDTATLTTSEHPVLAFPEPAPLPAGLP